MCRGFISNGWSTLQGTRRGKGQSWGVAMHKTLFDAFLQLWEKRNSAVHGTAEEQQQADESGLRTKVRTLYAKGRHMLPCDRRWIYPCDLAAMLTRQTRFQRQWARMAERAIPMAVTRKSTLPAGQRLITGFLPAQSGLADDPP